MAMVGVSGCWRVLPPPAAPAQTVPSPSAEIGPAPEGASTVVLDTDQPAQVREVDAMVTTATVGAPATAVATIARPLCITPCAVHLSRGSHQLQFQLPEDRGWGGDSVVQVGVHPVAYRYALGHRYPRIGARITGWVLFAAGMGLTASGALYWSVGDQNPDLGAGNLATIGQVQTVVGAGVAVAGILTLLLLRPEIQPGTGVQWELAEDTALGRAPQSATR
jgi:hypothetical protein